jgi:hypothetical protein
VQLRRRAMVRRAMEALTTSVTTTSGKKQQKQHKLRQKRGALNGLVLPVLHFNVRIGLILYGNSCSTHC